jgi:hypothetical protein
MPIIFKNDNNVIVYTLEKVISYTQRSQQIFVAQCVWWLVSIIKLKQGLITDIDNLRTRSEMVSIPKDVPITTKKLPAKGSSSRQDRILEECEEYLRDSRWLLNLAKLKASGKSKTEQIHPIVSSKQSLRISKGKGKCFSKTEGIAESEIQRRKAQGECLHCAWPPGVKSHHTVRECIRKIRIESRTAERFEALWIESTTEDSSDYSSDT